MVGTVLLCSGLSSLLVAACTSEPAVVECTARIRIRFASDEVFDPERKDGGYVTISDGGYRRFDKQQDFSWDQANEHLVVKEYDPNPDPNPELPDIDLSYSLRVGLVTYKSDPMGEIVPTAIDAGATPSFACTGSTGEQQSLYVGPANGTHTAFGLSEGRSGSTVTPLGGSSFLIFGGQDPTPVTLPGKPAAALLYDHSDGTACCLGAECDSVEESPLPVEKPPLPVEEPPLPCEEPPLSLEEPPPPLVEHTATALPGGSVLLAGGRRPREDDDCEGTAWYIDGNTGVKTGIELVEPRRRHTAVLLSPGRNVRDDVQGQVLLCGGLCDGRASNTCELVDPKDRNSTATAPMTVGRYDHSGTLLSSGNVLIAGGRNDAGTILRSAELLPYSREVDVSPITPCTETDDDDQTMCVGRAKHTATKLSDDNVLIVGGDADEETPMAEVYCPSDRNGRSGPGFFPAWSGGGQAGQKLVVGHTVTRLNCMLEKERACKYLIAGGTQTADDNVEAAALFNPAKKATSGEAVYQEDAYKPLEAHVQQLRRVNHAAVAIEDGTVLLVGGQTSAWDAVKNAVIFFPCEEPLEVPADEKDPFTCPVP